MECQEPAALNNYVSTLLLKMCQIRMAVDWYQMKSDQQTRVIMRVFFVYAPDTAGSRDLPPSSQQEHIDNDPQLTSAYETFLKKHKAELLA